MFLYVDMDGVLCDYDSAYKSLVSEELKYPQSKPGFFLGLNPIKHSVETVKELAQKGVQIYFLTRPSVKNPHCWTEKAQWIEKHFGPEWLHQLIICSHKSLFISDNAYLIDDFDHAEAGQANWKMAGRLIHFGNPWNWLDIKNFVLSKC